MYRLSDGEICFFLCPAPHVGKYFLLLISVKKESWPNVLEDTG